VAGFGEARSFGLEERLEDGVSPQQFLMAADG